MNIWVIWENMRKSNCMIDNQMFILCLVFAFMLLLVMLIPWSNDFNAKLNLIILCYCRPLFCNSYNNLLRKLLRRQFHKVLSISFTSAFLLDIEDVKYWLYDIHHKTIKLNCNRNNLLTIFHLWDSFIHLIEKAGRGKLKQLRPTKLCFVAVFETYEWKRKNCLLLVYASILEFFPVSFPLARHHSFFSLAKVPSLELS